MKNIKKAKNVYNSIKVPKELDYVVNRAITSENRKRNYSILHFKYAISTIACLFLCFVVMINLNPSFAASVEEIPIIGNIAKVFTVLEFKNEDDTKLIEAKIPALENTGNTELEKRINYEIMLKINEILKETEERAKEYKEAVIATVGKEEDYKPINIQIGYDLGYSSDKIVSFEIHKSETLASSYTEYYYYNIDIETGKKLNLRDLLGENFKKIVDDSIYSQIEERSKNPENSYFKKEDGGFNGIENEYQDFYINKDGKIVIVFEKYEIAPGYMGKQEFIIDKKIV